MVRRSSFESVTVATCVQMVETRLRSASSPGGLNVCRLVESPDLANMQTKAEEGRFGNNCRFAAERMKKSQTYPYAVADIYGRADYALSCFTTNWGVCKARG